MVQNFTHKVWHIFYIMLKARNLCSCTQ